MPIQLTAQSRLAPGRCAPAAPRRGGLPDDAPARRSPRPVARRLAARVESAGVQAINQELRKRPTSTRVRYRLQWQPLGEDDGTPVGLEAAPTSGRRKTGASSGPCCGNASAPNASAAMPILNGTRAKVAAAWSINSGAPSTTAAGTVSVWNACRMGVQDRPPPQPPDRLRLRPACVPRHGLVAPGIDGVVQRNVEAPGTSYWYRGQGA